MNHSTCSGTSSLVFIVLVLSLLEITPVVPLIPTFVAISLLPYPNAPLVVSSIGIYRTPTVMGQMAKSVTLREFGSTWTIMEIVAFRTQRLRSAVMFLLPVPCSTSTLITGRSSLIPSSSRGRDPAYAFLLIGQEVDLIFSGGGGNDESSATANSVMHASADGNHRLERTRSSISTSEGSARARCSSSSSLSFLTLSSLSSALDDSLSSLSPHRQDSQQDPPQGPLHPPLD
nr:hypothetical protein [Tanacetum cinerariifolium]